MATVPRSSFAPLAAAVALVAVEFLAGPDPLRWLVQATVVCAWLAATLWPTGGGRAAGVDAGAIASDTPTLEPIRELAALVDDEARGDRLHPSRFALELKSRVSGDYRQRVKPAKLGNDVLGDPIAEVILIGVSTHVAERQNCNGRSGA